MTCHIDQSNKTEQTEKDTVIALSNGVKFTLLIRAKDKIDLEYQGSEKIIKDRLIEYSRLLEFNFDWSSIKFKNSQGDLDLLAHTEEP